MPRFPPWWYQRSEQEKKIRKRGFCTKNPLHICLTKYSRIFYTVRLPMPSSFPAPNSYISTPALFHLPPPPPPRLPFGLRGRLTARHKIRIFLPPFNFPFPIWLCTLLASDLSPGSAGYDQLGIKAFTHSRAERSRFTLETGEGFAKLGFPFHKYFTNTD